MNSTQLYLQRQADHLNKSERGRKALRVLHQIIERGDLSGLDATNQAAFVCLLMYHFGKAPMTTRDVVAQAVAVDNS